TGCRPGRPATAGPARSSTRSTRRSERGVDFPVSRSSSFGRTPAMKFLLMVMTDEAAARAMSADERDRRVAEHGAFGRELRVAGKWVSSARLRFAPEATTIRRDGVVTDGPFAETKEVLGGFYLIEAESTAEAVAWAKKLPLGDAGAVEVRPAATGATWRGPLAGAKK